MATNYEYFKDEIINLVSVENSMASSLGVMNGRPVRCSGMSCNYYDFNNIAGISCCEKEKPGSTPNTSRNLS